SIVAVASIGGTLKHGVGNSVYGASKSALESMMKSCANELAKKGVRVNLVSPGMVETPLIRGGAITEEQLKIDMETRYPLGRYGEPNDVAHGIIYLLSNASSWVTGHSLVIDGGMTI
ncbi:MAG: SDR family oxidoreductase, partial [Victivallales bacterium]|nr:SDR family oxidoreductase [Victivallales bacterium]